MNKRNVAVAAARVAWLAAILAGGALAQEARVLEAGPHHRVMQVVRPELDATGRASWVTGQYVELCTGLNRWDPEARAYVPAEALWEELNTGHVIARRTAHQLILSPEPGAEGAVELWGPGGLYLRSSLPCSGFGHACHGTKPDHDAVAWIEAEELTDFSLDEWLRNCCLKCGTCKWTRRSVGPCGN